MDSSSTFPVSSDPKTQIMNQIRQEAAINNARQLIEVCPRPFPFLVAISPIPQTCLQESIELTRKST